MNPPAGDEYKAILKVLRDKIDLERGFGVDGLPLFERSEKKDIPEAPQDRLAALKEVEQEAMQCVACPLHATRTNVVFGTGNPDADLFFIGEAPGYDEDQQGEPFVGRAGQLLTKIIEAIDMKRSEVYIGNILKCRPPENRNPRPLEIVTCMPFLKRQIELIQPKVICALGTIAAQALLKTQERIGALRGKFHDYGGIKLMATYHPAYLLRNPRDKRKVWEDVQKVRDELRKG